MRSTTGWVDGDRMFYRDLGPQDAPEVLLHVHGFAISGTYLMPTAELLADRFRSVVPDLPGFGRSPRPKARLDFPAMADLLVRVMDELEIERATLVGNSMGCPVICEFDYRHHDRLNRAVLVSPAGGEHNRPLTRAVGQLVRDALVESPEMARVAVPDYLKFGPLPALRMFEAMTKYPALERLLDLQVPALAVLGSRDPLLPGPGRAKLIMRGAKSRVEAAVIIGAAHAINYSHPEELSWLIRTWLDDWDPGDFAVPDGVRVILQDAVA